MSNRISFQLIENGFKRVMYFSPAEIDGTKDIAFIERSSGSTGMPKGVYLSHASILCPPQLMRQAGVVLSLTCPFFISGLKLFINATLNGSIRVVNFGPFSLNRWFDVVERFKVTSTMSSASVAKRLLDHRRIETTDLSSIRYYICSGTKVSLDVIQKMNKYLKNGIFCNGYGSTEFAGLIAVNIDHQRNDCVGQFMRRCKAKIVNDQGERLGVGENGELCIKEPYPFSGYLGGDENADDRFDSEGFFKTGDIGRFDGNGDLFIVDRMKEMFKCAGFHVIPAELEEFLGRIEGVKQSCVVPIPDFEYDFLPAAVIVKSDGSTCTKQSIYDAVSSKNKLDSNRNI